MEEVKGIARENNDSCGESDDFCNEEPDKLEEPNPIIPISWKIGKNIVDPTFPIDCESKFKLSTD